MRMNMLIMHIKILIMHTSMRLIMLMILTIMLIMLTCWVYQLCLLRLYEVSYLGSGSEHSKVKGFQPPKSESRAKWGEFSSHKPGRGEPGAGCSNDCALQCCFLIARCARRPSPTPRETMQLVFVQYMGLLNTLDNWIHDYYYTKSKLNSKHNKHTNKQHMHNAKQHKHTNKQSKHNNTWFSTPEKARNPGHANHVLKTQL